MPMMPDAPSGSSSLGADRTLIARMAAREGAALREVAAIQAPAIHRIAYRMTGDAQEAEDIAQEALLRLWQAAPQWRHDDAMIAPWLGRVAINLSIDRLRRRKRVVGADDLPERADEAPLADELVEQEQRAAMARALVEALPERQRAAIVLTYFEELPNATAAGMMDMQIKAFESLLFRARAALRQACLEQDERTAA